MQKAVKQRSRGAYRSSLRARGRGPYGAPLLPLVPPWLGLVCFAYLYSCSPPSPGQGRRTGQERRRHAQPGLQELPLIVGKLWEWSGEYTEPPVYACLPLRGSAAREGKGVGRDKVGERAARGGIMRVLLSPFPSPSARARERTPPRDPFLPAFRTVIS